MRQLIESPRRVPGTPARSLANDFPGEVKVPDWRLEHVSESHPARRGAEAFIHAAYRQAFGADLSSYYPSIITLADPQERLLGALGARWAGGQELFLERYLDGPVELHMTAVSGRAVERDAVVELGNLALGRPAVTHVFMSLIGAWLQDFQVQWLVCALTGSLRRLFQRAGVELLDLAPAMPQRLGPDAALWGDYYDHDPRIVAIELVPSLQRFNHGLGLTPRRSMLRGGTGS